MGQQPVVVFYTFEVVTLLLAFGSLMVACLTFFRYDKWRKDDRTEITIRQVDQQARDGVALVSKQFEARSDKVDAALDAVTRKLDAEVAAIDTRLSSVEGELRNSIQQLDSRVRVAMTAQGNQLVELVENVRHIPTQADLSRLTETIGHLSRESGTNGAKLEGQERLLARIEGMIQRLEEHHLK